MMQVKLISDKMIFDMNKFKYKFKIQKLHVSEKHFSEDKKSYASDSEFIKSLNSLIGFPITTIGIDNNDDEFPYEGVFIAQCRAEDKASEIIATMMGISFGGSQHYEEDSDIKGRFVSCKIESIEQIE